MKSVKVGGDDQRRMRVLQSLLKFDFLALVGVTDKARLRRGTGFEFHGSFVKFFSDRVHKELKNIFSALHIIQDEHGDADFMAGFRDYILRDAPHTLFDEVDAEFGDSRSFVLLQLADFIAGTVRRQYERRGGGSGLNFIRELRPKLILQEWPWVNEPSQVDVASARATPFDAPVAATAVHLARAYVDRQGKSDDPMMTRRCAFLSFLLCELQFGRPFSFVLTPSILKHLNRLDGRPINKFELRSSVVAPLRDAGVLIASSNQGGYKLPTSVADLCEFVNHGLGIVKPLLDRLATCREQVRLATDGKLDLVDRDEYRLLQRLLAAAENTE